MPGRFVRPILALLFVLAALLTGRGQAGATVTPEVGQDPASGDAPPADVEHLRAIRAVANGEAIFSPGVAQRVLHYL